MLPRILLRPVSYNMIFLAIHENFQLAMWPLLIARRRHEHHKRYLSFLCRLFDCLKFPSELSHRTFTIERVSEEIGQLRDSGFACTSVAPPPPPPPKKKKWSAKEKVFPFNTNKNSTFSTAWCGDFGLLWSLNAPELHASSDVREPISLHQSVV